MRPPHTRRGKRTLLRARPKTVCLKSAARLIKNRLRALRREQCPTPQRIGLWLARRRDALLYSDVAESETMQRRLHLLSAKAVCCVRKCNLLMAFSSEPYFSRVEGRNTQELANKIINLIEPN